MATLPATVQQLPGNEIQYDTRPSPFETFATVLASGMQGKADRAESEKKRTSQEKIAAYPNLINKDYLQPTTGDGDTSYAGMDFNYKDPSTAAATTGTKEYYEVEKLKAQIEAIEGKDRISDTTVFTQAVKFAGDVEKDLQFMHLQKMDKDNGSKGTPTNLAAKYKAQKVMQAYDELMKLRNAMNPSILTDPEQDTLRRTDYDKLNVMMAQIKKDHPNPEAAAAVVRAELAGRKGITESLIQTILQKYGLPTGAPAEEAKIPDSSGAKKVGRAAKGMQNTFQRSGPMGLFQALNPETMKSQWENLMGSSLVEFGKEFTNSFKDTK